VCRLAHTEAVVAGIAADPARGVRARVARARYVEAAEIRRVARDLVPPQRELVTARLTRIDREVRPE
jgi:hypothetical protein